jgi:uncharacterized protein (TIGR02145 family)
MKSKASKTISFINLLAAILFIYGCEKDDPEYNQLPSLELDNPKDQSVFTLEDEMVLNYYAWDPDGEVMDIQLLINDSEVEPLNPAETEFSLALTNYLPGEYILKVIATDDQGGEISKSVKIILKPALQKFTDSRDGREYRMVKIGDQIWMAENLAYLPSVHSPDQYSETEPRYYVHNYSGDNVQEAKNHEGYAAQGVLYNWPAALIAAPDGWHLPTDQEWAELEEFIASEHAECEFCQEEGDPVGPDTYFHNRSWSNLHEYLKYTSGWCGGDNGLNTYSMSLRPCYIYDAVGAFERESTNHSSGSWWTASRLTIEDNEVWIRSINNTTHSFRANHTIQCFRASQLPPASGLAIRCIRDE